MDEVRQLREIIALHRQWGVTSIAISDVHGQSILRRIEEIKRLIEEAKILVMQGNNDMQDEIFDAGMVKLDKVLSIMAELGV